MRRFRNIIAIRVLMNDAIMRNAVPSKECNMRFCRILAAALMALFLSIIGNSARAFTTGEFVSFSQGAWGQTPAPGNAAALLQAQFNSVYAPVNDLLEIGIPGTAGFSAIFDDAT